MAGVLFLLTAPVESIAGHSTPFGLVLKELREARKKLIDKEIFEAMTQLKNICIAQGNTPMSGDYIIEKIMVTAQATSLAYSRLLTHWRRGQIELGCELFGDSLDTKISREMAAIFVKLETMNPIELTPHIEAYQSHIREERMTKYLKKQENISYLMYAPVIASAFFIMMNFIMIVVWMDTAKLIQNL